MSVRMGISVGLDVHGRSRTSDAELVLWGCEWVVFCWVGKSMISDCVSVGKQVWKDAEQESLCILFGR